MEARIRVNIAELVEQHYSLLYRYAYRMTGSSADAEDVTQQAFLTAQRKIDQLRDPQHARAWLITITRNIYLKQLRHNAVEDVVSLEVVGEPVQQPDAETEIDSQDLQQALSELSEEFRTPLILFYFGEHSYKDIAAQLELPIGTVMSRLSRGKAYLRGRLAAHEPAAAR